MCTGYVDKSKRRPYICGQCGRDIRDATHQPDLPGVTYVSARQALAVELAQYYPPTRYEPPQMALSFNSENA